MADENRQDAMAADVDGEVAIDAAEAALRAARVAPPAPKLVQLGSL